MKSLLLLLALIPCTSFAETILCVAEVGALVEDGGNQPATSSLANVSAHKFLLTKDNGKWVVKPLGKNYVLFDKCTSEYFCEHASGYAGAFLRSNEGTFSITWQSPTLKNGRNQLVVAKGRCSTI